MQTKGSYNTVERMQFMLFVCEIKQLAAFLCDLCVICERIITEEYSSYL
jgi:hypothetical protein